MAETSDAGGGAQAGKIHRPRTPKSGLGARLAPLDLGELLITFERPLFQVQNLARSVQLGDGGYWLHGDFGAALLTVTVGPVESVEAR